ncbi:hypothetical protein DI494_22345, partial [Stenotrophomonas maltophilia]
MHAAQRASPRWLRCRTGGGDERSGRPPRDPALRRDARRPGQPPRPAEPGRGAPPLQSRASSPSRERPVGRGRR